MSLYFTTLLFDIVKTKPVITSFKSFGKARAVCEGKSEEKNCFQVFNLYLNECLSPWQKEIGKKNLNKRIFSNLEMLKISQNCLHFLEYRFLSNPGINWIKLQRF